MCIFKKSGARYAVIIKYNVALSLSLCYHTTCVVSVSLYYLFRTIGLCVSRLIFHLVFFSLSAKKIK